MLGRHGSMLSKNPESTNIASDSEKKMEPKCFVGGTGIGLPPIPLVINAPQSYEVVSEITS